MSVTESAGIDRITEPVSGGVPLPRGMFAKDQAFALFDGDGAELPCQVLPLVVETDDTLRWETNNGPADRPAGWGATDGVVVCDRLFAANPSRRSTREDAWSGIR